MTTHRSPVPRLYPVRAAATVLGIGKTTVWKLVTDGTLETIYIGGRRMVRAESLEAVLATGTRKGVG
jgi:excisionase family DNA binding protein